MIYRSALRDINIVAMKSRKNDISGRYREDCTDILMIYRFNVRQSMRCFADISAINRENKARYLSIIVCIAFAQYCVGRAVPNNISVSVCSVRVRGLRRGRR